MIHTNYYTCTPKTCSPRTSFSSEPQPTQDQVHSPLMNVREDNDRILIELSMPGVSKDQIQIQLENDLLSISAERKMVSTDAKYLRREFASRKFKRTLKLSHALDLDSLKAEYTNGVLRISLQRKPNAVSQISVN